MARSTKEWFGKTDDSDPPGRVKLRIYDRAGGVCHICKLPIKSTETWHADHVHAIIAGGPNRESNLAPAHAHCNMAKAKVETKEKSVVAKKRRAHLGIKTAPQKPLQGRGFPKTDKPKTHRPSLSPRRMYAPVGALWPQPKPDWTEDRGNGD